MENLVCKIRCLIKKRDPFIQRDIFSLVKRFLDRREINDVINFVKILFLILSNITIPGIFSSGILAVYRRNTVIRNVGGIYIMETGELGIEGTPVSGQVFVNGTVTFVLAAFLGRKEFTLQLGSQPNGTVTDVLYTTTPIPIVTVRNITSETLLFLIQNGFVSNNLLLIGEAIAQVLS